jgi:putative transposase
MKGHQAVHSIATMGRVLGVSPSGYYAWQHRAPSPRAQRDAELTMKIHTIHLESRGTYGAPRVHAELAAQGIALGRKRVARLMRRVQLRGVSRRKWITTTTRAPDAAPAPDLVQRQFTAAGPDQLWVADITYVPTGAGFLYLAVVLDAWSRRVIGWAMETHLRTELVLAALDMALGQRRPQAVIHHSDHGCQYTSVAFGQRCTAAGVRPSMGSVGDAYDNALCESFFATVECELLDRTRFATPAAARAALFDFIEGWYNPRRRHSALGYLSPIGYERAHSARTPSSPVPPETAKAVLPPGATLTEGAAISLSPQTGHSRSVTRRGRV